MGEEACVELEHESLTHFLPGACFNLAFDHQQLFKHLVGGCDDARCSGIRALRGDEVCELRREVDVRSFERTRNNPSRAACV